MIKCMAGFAGNMSYPVFSILPSQKEHCNE
jgi:hypothetical protein